MDIETLLEKFEYDGNTGDLINKRFKRVVGTKNAQGYLVVNVDGKVLYNHRIIWILSFGDIPSGWSVDHIDQNKQNNKLSNLRVVPHKINMRNQKLRSTNSTGCMGVYKHPDGRWRARIKVDGTFKHIGLFKEKEDAIKARLEAEEKYGFHNNHGV